MKIYILIFLMILLVAFPVFIFADCSKSGASVVYINGIFGNLIDAQKDKDELEFLYNHTKNQQNINFISGFNPSHAVGLDDLLTSVLQSYGNNGIDYDLTNILLGLRGQLQTEKVILVGHSQGTFYTNSAYDYLTKNGVDKNSINVYNVATPADRVAGSGQYLTSSTDKVINGVVSDLAAVGFTKRPLPPNITLQLSKEQQLDPLGGHSFGQVYLAEAPDKIISGIDQELNNLKESSVINTPDGGCFVAPKTDILYDMQNFSYQEIDDSVSFAVASASSVFSASEFALNVLSNWVSQLQSQINQIVDQNKSSLTASISDQRSQENPSDGQPQESQDSQDQNQQNSSPDTNLNNPAAESRQDLLDDIQEKIDILKQEIAQLEQEQNQQNSPPQNPDQNQNNNQQQNNQDNQNPITLTSAGSGSSDSPIIYPKILISEVEILPISQRFVELYNPNSSDIALGGWYLQRKDSNDTSWNSFVSSTNFSGKIIPANGYFLISKQLANSDISSDLTLSNDNSLALKNPNGDISDKLGFGNAMDPELSPAPNPSSGQSIGRKVLGDGTEQDTDNNSADFELQAPTPRTQNQTYVAPPSQADTEAPVITLLGDSEITIFVGDNYVDQGASASDNVDGDITAKIITVNPVDKNTVGDYKITYDVSDAAGNKANEVLRMVHVIAVPQLLIIDVQIEGQSVDDDFIRLYNPNNFDVSLKNYRLVKRAETSAKDTTIKSWSKDDGAKISANQYYLWASSSDKNFPALVGADSWTAQNISANNGIALRYGDENTGKIIDAVGWGTFDNVFFENKSFPTNPGKSQDLARIKTGGNYKNTPDNSQDFAIITSPIPSNNDTITSTVYMVSPLSNGTGTISGVKFQTSKSAFESFLTKDQPNQTWDDSGITNPVATGNTLVVTAQDGVTKATYAITVDTTNWAQGAINSFTPSGSFVLNVSDFMPDSPTWCAAKMGIFRGTYPSQGNGGWNGSTDCGSAYGQNGTFNLNMSAYTTPGEYDFYIAYCGANGHACTGIYPMGEYYRMSFDGTNWSALPIDSGKTRLSMNPVITFNNYYLSQFSATYDTNGIFIGGSGGVSNIPFGVPKSTFESAIILPAGATLDNSGLADPIVTGNSITVTAQDGVTKIIYTTTTDIMSWPQEKISSYTQDGHFALDDSVFMPDNPSWCWAYLGIFRDTYPSQRNGGWTGSTDCGSAYGQNGTYDLNMSNYTIPGEYDFYISYCLGQNQCSYDYHDAMGGAYYRMNFDGTNWSPIQ